MKKLMILGAGIYQVPLIAKAKEMGIYTIVVSCKGNYPGFALADCVYDIDTTNYEAILEVALEEKIDGICTAGTDVAVRTIGYVCERMKLHGLSEEAAICVTDKSRMKEAFTQYQVATAKFEKVYSMEDVERAIYKFGYPVVIKAVDTSGSRGVIVVKEEREVKEAYEDACKYCRKDYVLVEEYIQAHEIGIDGFVIHNKLQCMYPHEKFVYHTANSTIPAGHVFPYICSELLYNQMYEQLQRAIQATGINNCPVNADVFIKGNEVLLIELGGRSGATCIPELITIHTGENYYEKMIQNALGEEVHFRDCKREPVMAKLLVSPINGKIVKIDSSRIQNLEAQGITIQFDYGEGEQVEKPRNGTSRIGHVIVQTDSKECMDRIVEDVMSCIQIE